VIALLIILGLWLGSAALVVPYLLHVARFQVDQGANISRVLPHELTRQLSPLGSKAGIRFIAT
jgi:hypothetical protein